MSCGVQVFIPLPPPTLLSHSFQSSESVPIVEALVGKTILTSSSLNTSSWLRFLKTKLNKQSAIHTSLWHLACWWRHFHFKHHYASLLFGSNFLFGFCSPSFLVLILQWMTGKIQTSYLNLKFFYFYLHCRLFHYYWKQGCVLLGHIPDISTHHFFRQPELNPKPIVLFCHTHFPKLVTWLYLRSVLIDSFVVCVCRDGP